MGFNSAFKGLNFLQYDGKYRERFISVSEEAAAYVFREDLKTVQDSLQCNMSVSTSCFTVKFMITFDSRTLQTSTIN